MKHLKLASALLAFVAPVAFAQTSTWKTDPAHSEVDFSVKHLAISNVHGRLGKIDATIVYDDKGCPLATTI